MFFFFYFYTLNNSCFLNVFVVLLYYITTKMKDITYSETKRATMREGGGYEERGKACESRAVHRNRIHTVIRVLYTGTRTVPSALKGTYITAVIMDGRIPY